MTQQRFSGPELAPLLEEVVAAHGASVAIAEVNKVRTGGVGGFFCRELFEVLVDTGPSHQDRADAGVDLDISPAHRDPERSGAADLDIGPDHRDRDQHRATRPAGDDDGQARFISALQRRVDEASETEASMARQSRLEARGSSTAGGRTEQATPTRSASDAAAATAAGTGGPATRAGATMGLPAGTATEADVDERAPAWPPERDRVPGGNPTTDSTLRLTSDPPSGEATGRDALGLTPNQPVGDTSPRTSNGAGATPGFWSRLANTDDELHAFVPIEYGPTAVVGPLASAVPVVRHLQCQHRLDSDDVVVLTNRAEIVSEPSWQLVRSGRQLIELSHQSRGAPKLLLIDVPVELPGWVAPLLVQLRVQGLELVRYVVSGRPAPDDLLDYWEGVDNPYVVDLVGRLEPEHVVRLVEHGHPVASVAGVDLSPALLLAMKGAGRAR
jgi:hypothetical protein